jgi:hypothetical protein
MGMALDVLALPILDTPLGVLNGGWLGGLCGATCGLAGVVIGRRAGWCLAGLLGGLCPLFLFWYTSGVITPPPRGHSARLVVLTAPVGLMLGWALSRALHSGNSGVPGVRKLATIITTADPPPRARSHRSPPAELTPACGPEGRGDELSPLP